MCIFEKLKLSKNARQYNYFLLYGNAAYYKVIKIRLQSKPDFSIMQEITAFIL